MFDKVKKIIIFSVPALSLFFWTGQASAYRVSGVVEFSYRNYNTKTGGISTSSGYWLQTYQLSLSDYVWDPRFLLYSASVGYNVTSGIEGTVDNKNLSYNLSTSFFPGRAISWNLFGNRTKTTIENIAGDEIMTTSYGGGLRLNLMRLIGGGRNNNNNNNNGGGGAIPLPSISLSYVHAEAESLNTGAPLREERDKAAADLGFNVNSALNLTVSGSLEKYDDLLLNRLAYEHRTASLYAKSTVSRDSSISLRGTVTDFSSEKNAASSVTDESTAGYEALYTVKPDSGPQQTYRYEHTGRRRTDYEYAADRAEGFLIFRLTDVTSVQAGVEYLQSEYVRQPNPLVAGDTGEVNSAKSGGVRAGISNYMRFAPEFMGPFTVFTQYDLNTGFQDVSSETAGQPEGSGWYYANIVGLGFESTQWKKDSLSLTYNYSNRRDHSAAERDVASQAVRLALASYRIPRTTVQGSASYDALESTTKLKVPLVLPGAQLDNTSQQRRQLRYDLKLSHTIFPSLTVEEGATHGQATQKTFTLATVTQPSASTSEETVLYINAAGAYPITRMLSAGASFREELRILADNDIRSHEARATLNYRLRSIFVTLEYRWRQEAPDNALRTTQQYVFAKLSRPF